MGILGRAASQSPGMRTIIVPSKSVIRQKSTSNNCDFPYATARLQRNDRASFQVER